MQTQQANSTPKGGTPAVRSWRLLLLILLLVLPVTVALASQEPLHMPGGDAFQHEGDGHAHTPSETPTCHHVGHYANVSAVASGYRNAEVPTPDETVAAIPSHGPTHDHLTIPDSPLRTAISEDRRTSLPVYLLTRRLRV